MLAVLVCVYGTVKLITLIWRFHGLGADGRLGSALLQRYLIVLVLRLRFRRFLFEFLAVGGLVLILILLLSLHW